jgi:hypothetical protein
LRITGHHHDVDLKLSKLGGDRAGTFGAALPRAVFDHDGAALDPAQFSKPPHKRLAARPFDGGRTGAQQPDCWNFGRLLSARRQRQTCSRTTEKLCVPKT